jgi:hypothetical protein
LRPRHKPGPGLRESARAVPRSHKYRRAARLGCNGAQSVVACCSTAVTAGFVREHRAPVATNNRRIHRDTHHHHRCTRMCKRSNLPPVSRSSPAPSKLQLPTTNLAGPVGCDTRPLRRDMSFATGVDKVVPTRCVQHLPPCPLTSRPRESTRTKTS